MILIGMFDSPFVRRVAISAKRLGLAFEHRNWSVGKDFDRIREYNPLGRVPTLVPDSGEALMESGAILDWLDEQAGAESALLPRAGAARRDALRVIAIATGGAEKGVLQLYEGVFRPVEKQHAPWVARCRAQSDAALDELERIYAARQPGPWFGGAVLGQADITTVCVFTFLSDALQLDTKSWPTLTALAARAEALPEFRDTRTPFFRPQTSA